MVSLGHSELRWDTTPGTDPSQWCLTSHEGLAPTTTPLWLTIWAFGNGMLPDSTKPLPWPMLTYHQWVLWQEAVLLSKPKFVLKFSQFLVVVWITYPWTYLAVCLVTQSPFVYGVSLCATYLFTVFVNYIAMIRYWNSTGVFLNLGVSADPNK